LRPHSVLSVVSDRRTPELSTLSLPGALPISLRLVAQHIGRREPGAVALGEALELAHDARGAEVVGVSQRAAAERREPEAEDGADVAVAGRAYDPLPDRSRCFVQHYEHE